MKWLFVVALVALAGAIVPSRVDSELVRAKTPLLDSNDTFWPETLLVSVDEWNGLTATGGNEQTLALGHYADGASEQVRHEKRARNAKALGSMVRNIAPKTTVLCDQGRSKTFRLVLTEKKTGCGRSSKPSWIRWPCV